MSRKRQVVYLVVGAFAMIDAIRRVLIVLFGKPEPIDIWILGADIVIIALIVWLDVPEKFHRKKTHRIALALNPFVAEGLRLLQEVPFQDTLTPGSSRIFEWTQSVLNWRERLVIFLLNTQLGLRRHSCS
jgi:hypothetical protein